MRCTFLISGSDLTFGSGDVHLAGIGQFFSNPKLNIPRENDHRYIPNVISSAIVNTPPPNSKGPNCYYHQDEVLKSNVIIAMADILNKRNKVHHLDNETDEDMYPIFDTDVDGKPRNNKRLLPSLWPYSLNCWIRGIDQTLLYFRAKLRDN